MNIGQLIHALFPVTRHTPSNYSITKPAKNSPGHEERLAKRAAKMRRRAERNQEWLKYGARS